MPTYRSSSLVPRLALTLAAFGFGLEPAFAADSASPSVQPPRPSVPSPIRTQSSAVTVDFAGGSVADFVAAAAKSGGASFNLIGEKADLATALPSFSLRDADPSSVAAALNLLLSQKGLSITQTGGVFVLTRGNPQVARDSGFESFQITPYLEYQSVDDIVGAIRAAWELNPANKAEALQIKYHPATNLLLASGSREALNTATRVVGSLRRSAPASAEGAKTVSTTTTDQRPRVPEIQKADPKEDAARIQQWTTEIERRRALRGPNNAAPPSTTTTTEKK